MPSESDFLQWVRSQQQRSNSAVRVGIGDDLAVLNWPDGDLLLVGIDQVLDGVHFDSTIHSPRSIGRKAMNRNLSDCAAMACLAAAAVVSVVLPRGASNEFAQELFLGLRDASDPFDCPIVGGDTSAWDGKLAMSVAILGRSAGITPLTRSGARFGDGIFVTGALGGSILGRHLTFAPRLGLARELARRGDIHSMIDISDGLARDLDQLCIASGVGGLIEAERIPIHDDARTLSQQDGRPPLDHALEDGEDHELLFTSAGEPSPTQCIRIGTVIEASTNTTQRTWIEHGGQRRPLLAHGWVARW